MNPSEAYERVPSDGAAELLKRVLEFRETCQQLPKPEDVNHLLGLFPLVGIRDGYVLDYVQSNIGDMATGIQPFARADDNDDIPLVSWFDDEQEQQAQEVEQLYQYLSFEPSCNPHEPVGRFPIGSLRRPFFRKPLSTRSLSRRTR
jgi:hypothetical protein